MERNNLEFLPYSIGNLQRLSSLSLSGNRLTELPYNIIYLDRLKNLLLYGNKLSSLPDHICDMRSIKSIKVSNNNLCERYFDDCIEDFYPQNQSDCCDSNKGLKWEKCPQ